MLLDTQYQLLQDVRHYGLASDGLVLDSSHPCQEGHWTEYLDGWLEEMSDVVVRDGHGEALAEGWLDFIHTAADNRLVVFWVFLNLRWSGCWQTVKGVANHPRPRLAAAV